MLSAIHFLLTYMCNSECDHCFLYCSPKTEGTFTLDQLAIVLDDSAENLKSVERVCFEGGEPFLFYPLLLEAVKLSRQKEFMVDIVTNAYFATCEKDALLWLKPLAEIGIEELYISDDQFHYEGPQALSPALIAAAAARRLGLYVEIICIDKDFANLSITDHKPGKQVTGGNVMFRGRAAEQLAGLAPGRPAKLFDKCPHEDLVRPERVHIDPFGNVHVCQGICIGNVWEDPLSEIMAGYDADSHPLCGPLAQGGPFKLARVFTDLNENDLFADACHLCYSVRLAQLDRFPVYLKPRQVYGQIKSEDITD